MTCTIRFTFSCAIQLRRDSRDLAGKIPGDVLLLFGDPESTPFIT